MKIKKFRDLSKEQLQFIIDIHYNYWIKYNPQMVKKNSIYKFTKLYTQNQLPFGIALIDDDENIVGFCVFKIENLKKYPEIFPWISDVMIIERYRGKGYGKLMLSYGEQILKQLGYKKIYVWTDQVPGFYKKLGFIYKQRIEKNEGGDGELFYKELF